MRVLADHLSSQSEATLIHNRLRSVVSRFRNGIFSRGALSFLIAAAGINISNFLFHILVSRLLGPESYGALGALLSVLSVLSVPLGAVQVAVTQAVVGHASTSESLAMGSLARRGFFAGLVAMAGFLAIAPALDGFLHFQSFLPVALVGVWIPIATMCAVLQGALIGRYRFSTVALATFAGMGLMRLVVGALLGLKGAGVVGAVTATIAGQLLTASVLVFAARKDLLRPGQNAQLVRTRARDMSLSVFALSGYTVFTGIDTFLARHYFPAATSGGYAAAAVAAHIALFLPGALVTVVFPHLADGRGVSAASRKAFGQAVLLSLVLGLLTAAALAVLARPVVAILFGTRYLSTASVVVPLAPASALFGLLGLMTYLHLARRSLVAISCWAGVLISAALIAFDHSGPLTLAWIMLGTSLGTLVVAVVPALIALLQAAANDASKNVQPEQFSKTALDFTLVVPFYHPGPSFRDHLIEVMETLDRTGCTFEVLAVSDGSDSESEHSLEGLPVRMVCLPHNQGKGAALRTGFVLGRGQYLGFIDSDGDIPASLLAGYIDVIRKEQPDILFGSKRHVDSQVVYPWLRRIYSFGYQQLTRVLFRLPVRDTQTGLKIIRRDVLEAALPRMVEKRFAFDLELFVVARHLGFRHFVELPVIVRQRFTSTISVSSARAMLTDTLAIFYRLRILRYYTVKDVPMLELATAAPAP